MALCSQMTLDGRPMTLTMTGFILLLTLTAFIDVTDGQSPEIWFQPVGKTTFVHQTWTLTMTVNLNDYSLYFTELEYEIQQFQLSIEHEFATHYDNATQLERYKHPILSLVKQEIVQLNTELNNLKQLYLEIQQSYSSSRKNNKKQKRSLFSYLIRKIND